MNPVREGSREGELRFCGGSAVASVGRERDETDGKMLFLQVLPFFHDFRPRAFGVGLT